jgi:hypothetical protein
VAKAEERTGKATLRKDKTARLSRFCTGAETVTIPLDRAASEEFTSAPATLKW